MLTLKVNGYQEAKDILDDMPRTMQKSMLRSALKSSAKPFVQGARNRVPVRSGELKRQIKVVSFRDKSAPKTEVDVAVKPVFSKTKKKKANQYYGKFIHEGTVDPRYPRKKGGVLVFTTASGDKVFARHVKGIKPRPFIEESYTENQEKVVSGFGDALATSVEKYVNKHFKKVDK
ncbi:MAG: HK97-gp10 family putative phage morphogenesis protein [Candidatus Cryptobacteroides sp.]|jgi:HK97 gp10 family phage protein